MTRTSVRVAATYVALTGATVLIIAGAMTVLTILTVRAHEAKMLGDTAAVLAVMEPVVPARLHTGDADRGVLSALPGHGLPSGLAVAILNADGSVIESRPESLPAVWSPGRLPGTVKPAGIIRDPNGTPFEYALQPLSGGSGSWLLLIRAPSGVDSRKALVAFLFYLVGLAAAAVAGGLLSNRLRKAARHIAALRDVTNRYAVGELDFHWTPAGPHEIRGLGADLVQMAARLRARLDTVSTQRNQLRTILSSMVEGIIVLGGDDGIITINNAAGVLFGVTPSDGVGKSLLTLVRVPELHDLAGEARTAPGSVERTITVTGPRPVHLQVHATRIGVDTGSLSGGVLLVMNDISRIKQLEAVRTDFVANVSHELKTPVTAIKGFVETLLDDESIDREQATRFLQIVLKHTNRLTTILEDLLSLSRLEQSDLRIELVPCDIDKIVESVVELCRTRADAKSISVSHTRTGRPEIRANPSLLEQAILNLVDNAIKYSGDSSDVSVRTASESGAMTISVRDHGPGIREADLPRVFERFYRTDKARSRELGGTGLGLAIVKHIALLHGGEVGVESRIGEGSSFTLTIPRTRETAASSDDPQVLR